MIPHHRYLFPRLWLLPPELARRYANPMTDFVVRCPNCTQGARVPFEARGQLVECPRCGLHFPALPEPPKVPRNPLPAYVPTVPVVEQAEHEEPEHHAHNPHGLLIAVALLPLGVPLLWLTAGA